METTAGPREGFEALYRTHYAAMVRLGYLLTGSNEAAEDVVQDVFLRARDRLPLDHPASYLRAAVVNAYDNTIVYTDHVLAESIELLKSLGAQYDSLLIYVSDHGESLGEHGLYLHAAPYFIAPEEQIHVPLVMWMSEGYRTRSKTDLACLRARTSQPATHDDVYHTVLGALGLRSDVYRRDLDLLATCRTQW